jgi:dienelactone hydrolase
VTTRTDVTIPADGGVTLAAGLYRPEGHGPFPGITTAHGFGAIKELGLDATARAFADAGFVAIVHELALVDGTPFDPYDAQLPLVIDLARSFFLQQLHHQGPAEPLAKSISTRPVSLEEAST